MEKQLKLNSQGYDQINSGLKSATLRLGKREVEKNLNIINRDTQEEILVKVVNVKLLKKSELTPLQLKKLGYTSNEELWKNMDSFYPSISSESDFTYIEFEK